MRRLFFVAILLFALVGSTGCMHIIGQFIPRGGTPSEGDGQ
jgi:hypothetical protein